jgi:hypothetical protein
MRAEATNEMLRTCRWECPCHAHPERWPRSPTRPGICERARTGRFDVATKKERHEPMRDINLTSQTRASSDAHTRDTKVKDDQVCERHVLFGLVGVLADPDIHLSEHVQNHDVIGNPAVVGS